MRKAAEYAQLVEQRKRCKSCVGLANPSCVADGRHDSAHIGPWSRLHGDLDAPLMVVGQDWGDVAYFEKNAGLDNLRNPTMRTLQVLLGSASVVVSLDRYDDSARGLFLTNAVLCLKQGGLQARVQKSWFKNCASRFLLRQVDIIRPRVVVALGERAYRALCWAHRSAPLSFRQAVDAAEPVKLRDGVVMVPVYHCGNRILNTHRRLEQQLVDWQRVAEALASRPNSNSNSG